MTFLCVLISDHDEKIINFCKVEEAEMKVPLLLLLFLLKQCISVKCCFSFVKVLHFGIILE